MSQAESVQSDSGIYIGILAVLLLGVCVFAYISMGNLRKELDISCANRITSEINKREFLIKSKGAGDKCLSLEKGKSLFVDCEKSNAYQKFYYDATNSTIKNAAKDTCIGIDWKSAGDPVFYGDNICPGDSPNFKLIPMVGSDGPRIMAINGFLYYHKDKFGVLNNSNRGAAPNEALAFEFIKT